MYPKRNNNKRTHAPTYFVYVCVMSDSNNEYPGVDFEIKIDFRGLDNVFFNYSCSISRFFFFFSLLSLLKSKETPNELVFRT